MCGLNFELSGQYTWRARSRNSGDLKGKVCRLLERTPEFQRESSRLCKKSKKCFRRIESPIKRSKDFDEGERGLIECYEKTASESKNICARGESDRFKRVAEQNQYLQTYCQKKSENLMA